MFRRALAPAAVLLLATACSGRANDLDTYYETQADAPILEATIVPGEPSIVIRTVPPNWSQVAVRPPAAPPTVDLAKALLTERELAGEGVDRASSFFSYLPLECSSDTAEYWDYPSGSTIEQRVHSLPAAAERVAEMREQGACVAINGTPTEGPDLGELGDDRYSWCFADAEDRGCGAAVAEGDLLTVVVVKAGSTQRAAEAIARIAPLAADALDRV